MTAPPLALPMADAIDALASAARDPARADEALTRALDLWRAVPLPALADLIERLAPPAAPIRWTRGANRDEAQRQWLALAAEPTPATVGTLLAALTARLTIASELYGLLEPNYAARKYRALLERIAAVRRWPPDPRVATRLVRLLADGAYSAYDLASVGVIYGPVLEAIVAVGDVRAAGALDAIAARPASKVQVVREWLSAELPGAAARLCALRPPVAPPALVALLDELAPARAVAAAGGAATTRSAEALLDEILARPDDEPRAVYADLLTDAGDPRGELITLQLALARAEGDGAAALRRVGSLLKRHGKEWLGPLAPVAKHPRWERGFLASLELAQRSAAPDAGWEEAARAAALATVRRLTRGRANEGLYLRFVSSPAARSLVDIDVPSSAFLDELAALPVAARLTRLRLERLTSAMRARLETAAFPSLRRLLVPVTMATASTTVARLAKARPALERIDLRIADLSGAVWASTAAALLRALLEETPLRAVGVALYNGSIVGVRRTDEGGLAPIVDEIANQDEIEAADDLLAALGLRRGTVASS
jgi:uncharacterized protein (TIGR02996 family)